MRRAKLLLGSAPNELPVGEGAREASGWKRSVHGGSAWAASGTADNLHQPQDGAQETGALLTARTRMSLREPEDARLTGGTRSLMRRVMGLNVTTPADTRKPHPRPVPATPHTQVA
jgi:hypothetical protein